MNIKSLVRKGLTIGLIILLFVGTCINPTTGQDIERPITAPRGEWLYVGGDGPGNYTTIQEAINNASSGDIVFVYDDSAPYHEILTIDHSIRLIGENRNSTIINQSGRNLVVILIVAEQVLVQGFTLLGDVPSIGVRIHADNATISDVWIRGLQNGIIIDAQNGTSVVKDCLIRDCVIEGANIGLYTDHAWNVTISNNLLRNHDAALGLLSSFNCTVSSNLITDSYVSFSSYGGANNLFVGNTITACEEGVFLESSNEQVINNNFLNVTKPAYFYRHPWILFMLQSEARLYPEYEFNRLFVMEYRVFGSSVWSGNYWNEPRTQPYPIPGWRGDFFIMLSYTRDFPPTRLAFDAHPAQVPYDLPVVPS